MRFLRKEIVTAFDDWSTLPAESRRGVCLDIIRHFEDYPTDIGAICELTTCLADTGERWKWPDGVKPTVDVPSTGGPCSLTTLICPYILAASECFVPKLSVPGSVAGAIDVLAMIDGFQIELGFPAMVSALEYAHIAHSQNSDRLAPADGELFRVRADVGKKGIPALVIASLLSKKIAVACDTAVFDIRCWERGNFGTTVEACEENSHLLIQVGRQLGVTCVCVVTDVRVPPIPFIGRGESLFALYQILSATAEEELDARLRDHTSTCIGIAAEGLLALKMVDGIRAAQDMAKESIYSGRALTHLQRHIEIQHGTLEALQVQVERQREALLTPVSALAYGSVKNIRVARLQALMKSANAGPNGNNQFGIQLYKTIGDEVQEGEPLAGFRCASADKRIIDDAVNEIRDSFEIGERIHVARKREILATVRD